MIFKSLQGIHFNTLFEAFQTAFIDYEMQLNRKELQTMLIRRGFVPELSFAAFENDKIVSFTFNGIDNFNGIRTAYDTGTGTLKEFRGKGMATQIFKFSIPVLKEAGIKQYLLEVLQHNTKAVSVYKKLGFEVKREFNYFDQDIEGLINNKKEIPSGYHLHYIDLPSKFELNKFYDFIPSWQNTFDSIKRKLKDFKINGAFYENELIGFCIFEPDSGDITQIAVHKNHRRKGIATVLLQNVLKHNHHLSVKCINTQENCSSISGFLKSFNIPVKGKQFEMIKCL